MQEIHTKTKYVNVGEPFDHCTVLKVGDVVVGRYGKVKGIRGIVTKMTRSVNDRFGYIDWYIKVESCFKSFGSMGPGRWLVVEPAVGSFNRMTKRHVTDWGPYVPQTDTRADDVAKGTPMLNLYSRSHSPAVGETFLTGALDRLKSGKRICYDCGGNMTIEQAVDGLKALENANGNSNGEFEGWVHCQGPKEAFTQSNDIELCKAVEEAGIEYSEGVILVHRQCVKQAYEAERQPSWKENA